MANNSKQNQQQKPLDAKIEGGELGNAAAAVEQAEPAKVEAAAEAPAAEVKEAPIAGVKEAGKAPEASKEALKKVAVEAKHPTPERHIGKVLMDYIDEKLATNGLAQTAIEKKDARTLMLCAAEACVGIREVGGNNRGPMVELIEDTIGETHGMAWCMAFVQMCISYAELKTGVKSPLPVSAGVLDVWNKAPELRANAAPLPGAICIWKHGDTAQGHTGIVRSYPAIPHTTMTLVEGNTEAGVYPTGKVERDGGGVYATTRDKNGTGGMKVWGFLKPF